MFERKRIQSFYKKLLAFYPRAFRERFGESMEQTFNDLWNERAGGRAKQAIFGFVLWTFAETSAGIVKEHLTNIKGAKFMKKLLTSQKAAAIAGLLLAMPLAILLLIEVFSIEPLSGFYRRLTTEADGHSVSSLGKIFMLGALLLLPLGFLISITPTVRNARAGRGLTANPVNLSIAAALLIFIAALVAVNVIDQYPCWIGVPNCD